MISKNIKIDLHIHSTTSEWKEDQLIIKNSNIKNLNVLLDKLEENEISLFSITDHNVFDKELFLAFEQEIKKNNYNFVKKIIPGIEFDVKFDELNINKEKNKRGQINIYFDANNSEELDRIEKVMNAKENRTMDSKHYYTRDHLENILKEINLNTLLIASQTKSLIDGSVKNSDNKALSDYCNNPKSYLATGYINALEFQKPKVEGILKNSLSELNIENISLITFSDCHDWEVYPWHDSKNKKR